MSKKITILVSGLLALSISFIFLGSMAIMIGALPLAIIVFGVLALSGTDFYLTMRDSLRSGNGEGNGNGNSAGTDPEA